MKTKPFNMSEHFTYEIKDEGNQKTTLIKGDEIYQKVIKGYLITDADGYVLRQHKDGQYMWVLTEVDKNNNKYQNSYEEHKMIDNPLSED